jgi:hypothetical protein
MAKLFSVATTSAALSTAFSPAPSADKLRYVPPKLLGTNLNGFPVYSGYEGREIEFNALTNAQWSDLLSKTGTTTEKASAGFIRVPDWEFSGSTETWGNYSCVFWQPVEGMWRQGLYRLNVKLIVKRMIRISTAS